MRRIIIAALIALLPYAAHAQGINNPCPVATSSIKGCTSYGTAAGTAAQGGVVSGGTVGSTSAIPVITYNNAGQITSTSTAAAPGTISGMLSLSGTVAFTTNTPTLVPMDTKVLDTASICSVTGGTAGVCTPTTAGKYWVACTILVNGTTGPALNGALADVILHKGAGTFTQSADYAQIGSLLTPQAQASVSGITTMNGSTDTFSCFGYSQTTSPNFLGGGSGNVQMSFFYVGP